MPTDKTPGHFDIPSIFSDGHTCITLVDIGEGNRFTLARLDGDVLNRSGCERVGHKSLGGGCIFDERYLTIQT